MVSLPAIGYVVSPGLKQQNQEQWLTLGPVAGLPLGKPSSFPFRREITDGWTQTTQTGVAYAVTHDGQNVKVFYNVCTHFGSAGRVGMKSGVFICPCHDGLFSVDGEVLGGPPPRPLDQFQTKIENGQLQILLA